MRKIIFFCAIISLVLSACGQGSSDGDIVSKSNFQLDTVVTISLYGSDDELIIDDAFDEIERFEQLLSRKRSGSDPDILAKSGGEGFVPVSRDTIFLLTEGEKFSKLTGGLFDLSIGPLVSLWDISGGGYFPKDEERLQAMDLVNYEDILINNDEVMLKNEGMEVDLGAVAKGYIADNLKSFMIQKGVKSGIINLGGDIVLIGGKPGGDSFNIGVQDPCGATGESMGVLEISDRALVSSGTYERFFIYDGRTYHHIIDPKTGFPAENGLLQVTVVADDAMTGDVLSTSAFLLGLEKGIRLVDETVGASAIFITNDKKVWLSSGFNETFYIIDDEYSLEGELTL